jgi:hypothetical protein
MKEDQVRQEDFISFSSIKAGIRDFLVLLFKGFDFIFFSITKNIGWFLILSLIGLGLGYLYYSFKATSYRSEMIVYPNELARKDYYQIINNLNNLLTTRSLNDISQQLHLAPAEAEKIYFIEAKGLGGENLQRETSSKTGVPFKIELKLSQNSDIRALQQALLDYFNNNPYLKKLKETQKKINLERLHYIDKEQQSLDSLKYLYNHSLASVKVPATFYNNALNPADIYIHSNDLSNQKSEIIKWLNTQANALVVIDGLKRPNPTQSLPLVFYLVAGLLAGVILGIITSLMMAVKRSLVNGQLKDK